MKKTKTEKKVVGENTYTIKWIAYDDGSTQFYRKNDGFTHLHLMGLLGLVQIDLFNNFVDKVTPPTGTKKVAVIDGKEKKVK